MEIKIYKIWDTERQLFLKGDNLIEIVTMERKVKLGMN